MYRMGGLPSSNSSLGMLFTLGICGTLSFDPLVQSGAASSFREIPAHYALVQHSAEFSPPGCLFHPFSCFMVHSYSSSVAIQISYHRPRWI